MEQKNIGGNNIPIAKTGTVKPVQKAETPTEPSSGDVDIFRAAYKEQKKTNAAIAQANALAEQKKADEELKSDSEIPVLTNETIKKATMAEKDEKFKILFTFLIIIIVVLFTASCAYLAFGRMKNIDKPASIIETGSKVNTESVQLESPFTYQQIYNVNFPEGIQEKFKELYAQNQQFVGWLNVPGTSIDMPVYQSSNNSYYLKHDNYDTYTKYGVPFLDMYGDAKNLVRNSTIYGHNFDNGLIFDELHNYQDLEFYKENPVIEFDTLYHDYKWKVIAAFHTNGDSTGDNGYLFYYIAPRMGNNSFMKFYDELQQRSYIHTGVDVEPSDKVLTLSTCTYFFDRYGSLENARFAVVARLVREGESEEVDTSLATENENVRYPQLYYSVFGGTNPFRNASKWEAEAD